MKKDRGRKFYRNSTKANETSTCTSEKEEEVCTEQTNQQHPNERKSGCGFIKEEPCVKQKKR